MFTMNLVRRSHILVAGLLLLGSFGEREMNAQEVLVTRNDDGVVFQNGALKRVVSASARIPAPVSAHEITLIRSRLPLLDTTSQSPWFYFHVNGFRVTSRDPFWLFAGYQTRSMANGGTELTVGFRGATPPVESLRVAVVMQMFPGVSLWRERLVLSAPPGRIHRLTRPEGKVDGLFPAYTFRRPGRNPAAVVDVGIAGWCREPLPASAGSAFDDRALEEGTRVGKNLAQNYMYHPHEQTVPLVPGGVSRFQGPLVMVEGIGEESAGLLFAYEHGAPEGDPEQEYIFVEAVAHSGTVSLGTRLVEGAYCHDQEISEQDPFVTPWTMVGLYRGGVEEARELFWHYLDRHICEIPGSRDRLFYYNTWGMQRDEERRGHDVRKVLVRERVLQEIAAAAKLGVDVFVLDDGWQERFGDWRPDPSRFPDGLRWYVDSLKGRRMIPGIWMAAIATDSAAMITRAHPEWLVRDAQEQPVVGRWEKNIFCFDSDYREYFIDVCKRLIDLGITYFKWDGIDKHLCGSALHHHGTVRDGREERRRKQGYNLPLLVAEAIGRLKAYRANVVVEVDVTEAERSVGLAVLSEGRYFWMNNGASAYGDYSTLRSKSTRMITNAFHGLIPSSLQTFASYPHDQSPFMALRYSVNSTLVGGHGFWGNLAAVPARDLDRAGRLVSLSKRVAEGLKGTRMRVIGQVGASPEIYEWLDRRKATGQVIGFSGTAKRSDHVITGMAHGRMLAVLRNAYELRGDTLRIPFTFPMPESSREAFIVPNEDRGCTVVSSTSWLEDARIENGTLVIVSGAPGLHRVRWNKSLGRALVRGRGGAETSRSLDTATGSTLLTLTCKSPGAEFRISPSQ
jgi:hypothetical protein